MHIELAAGKIDSDATIQGVIVKEEALDDFTSTRHRPKKDMEQL